MKRFMVILICLPLALFGQGFKGQIKANVLPIDKFNYAGGFKLGYETIDRKWNFGVDMVNYLGHDNTYTSYAQDSVVRIYKNHEYIGCHGFAFSLLRTFPFKENTNRWIFGASFFTGFSKQGNTIEYSIYDTSRGYLDRWVMPSRDVIIKHGPKWNFVLAVFARMELNISRRFTLSPELNIPWMISNDIGGSMNTFSQTGINICLGYRLGRIETRS